MDTYIKGHGLLPGRKAGGSYAPKGSPGTLGTSQGKKPKYKRLIMMLCIDSIKLKFCFYDSCDQSKAVDRRSRLEQAVGQQLFLKEAKSLVRKITTSICNLGFML